MTDLVLGIDTGGTYTDGVLLDYHSREVLQTTKTLTTRHNLRQCILEALDALLPDDPARIKLVAISTTLATNAIAEGKGRPVALFLLGYDPDLARRFQFEEQFATPKFEYIRGGHTLHGHEQAPLDVETLLQRAKLLQDKVEAFAVSGYFSPFNPAHEEQAWQALTAATGRPVVLGHQLATRLNSVQRATTATLNASLLSILNDFVTSMRQSLRERGITAPLMVMRGDGALMRAGVADKRPVETVHSGPAASAIGGYFLARQDTALVIDVGGTTTDLAVVDGGKVNVREEGATVGQYSTAVRAAHVRSIGLGGDSLIGLDMESRLTLGPIRVTPLSYLAHQFPAVAEDLRGLKSRAGKRPSPEQVEYWFLQRKPRRFIQNARSRQVVDMLGNGPMALPAILEAINVIHPIQFDGQSLLRQEIIGRAALTPTDLLHLTGEYAPWAGDAARIAAEFMARLLGMPVDKLIRNTKTMFAERIAAEVVSFLSNQTLKRQPFYAKTDDLGLWLFEESLYRQHPYLGSQISLKIPIIGIGAPAAVFLPPVAELLQADLILPPHYQVANAVGAVAGSVMVCREAWVYSQMHGAHLVGYYVQTEDKRHRFPMLAEALAFARQVISDEAVAAARAAGGVEPQVELTQLPDGAESYRLRACAIGNPQMS